MKLNNQEIRDNALDFIGMSESLELCLTIDRAQLTEQMQYTIADAEDIEAIASLIEHIAAERVNNPQSGERTIYANS